MKRLKAAAWLAVLGLVTLPAMLAAESYWEGNAARIREGEITQPGLFAASNTFPRDTRIRVTNRTNGKTEVLTVVKRIERTTNVMILVSAEAGQKLGIGSDDVVPVRIAAAGDQGLSVSSEPTEQAYSQDPDVNPSVRAPAPAAPAASSPPAIRTSPPASASPQPAAQQQNPPAEQVLARTEPPARESATPSATPAAAAAPPSATAATTPAAPAAKPNATPKPESPPPEGVATAVAAAPAAAGPAAAESPAAAEASAPLALPATTPDTEARFLERIAARTPEKRVFAPPRGADVPEPVFAEEVPAILAEATPPTTAASELPATALDAPAVSALATTATGEPKPSLVVPADREERPFVQTERPVAGSATMALEPEAPALPSKTAAPQESAFVQATQPETARSAVATVATAPLEQERPFVQTERPAPRLADAAVLPPALRPATPDEPAEPVQEQQHAFVQTEQPVAQPPRTALALVPATPVAPSERPREEALAAAQPAEPERAGATAPSEPPAQERPFVQTEQPRPEAIQVAVETAPPSRESATEVMSMVDSPSETPASTEIALAEATLPERGAAAGAAAETARVGRIGPIEDLSLVATLGGERVTETVVTLAATEPVPPPQKAAAAAPAAATTTTTTTTTTAAAGGTSTAPQPGRVAAPPEPAATARAPAAATATAARAPSAAEILAVAVAREGLPLDAYYLQVAAVASERLAKDLVNALGRNYPSYVIPPDAAERSVYRVLVGPLAADERGAVLSQFRTGGYADAFIRYLN